MCILGIPATPGVTPCKYLNYNTHDTENLQHMVSYVLIHILSEDKCFMIFKYTVLSCYTVTRIIFAGCSFWSILAVFLKAPKKVPKQKLLWA